MAEFKLSEVMKDALKEDEKVLWAGRSADFKLAEGAMKTPLLLRWILSALIGIALLVTYIALYGGTEVFQPLIIVVIVAVFGFLFARPFMDKSALVKKGSYCITDKRVLTCIGNRDVYELGRNGLKLSFSEGENGCVHAALGSCAGIAEGKLRAKALAPKRGQGDVVTGFVLYNVESAVRDFFVS